MGKRGAGRRLNDQERMEILDILAREAKVKNVDLAKRYGVSEGAIRKLKQIKDTIRDRYVVGNEHNRDKRKRGGFVRNAKFEQELYEWICRMRESQAYQLIPLTQTAVRQQAMILAKKYESMATFKASPGWFARFCSRHRLDPPVQQADLQGGDPNDVTMAAVGDTVPGGPLASAYQVDPALTASAIASANAVFAEHLAAAAAAGAKADGSDLNCGEAVGPLDSVPHVDLTEIPSAVSVEEAVAEASETEPIALEVKKHEIVVQQGTTSEEEIFSLGL